MIPRLLADTHIVVWWLAAPKKLSREQERALDQAIGRREQVAISAITLIEIAVLSGMSRARKEIRAVEILRTLDASSDFQVLPITMEVAAEVAAVGGALGPVDRTIVCTARVHGLRLLTSDDRIIGSRLVPVIE